MARWDVLTFIAHVVDHIPEPAQQMVRYWGFYANGPAANGARPQWHRAHPASKELHEVMLRRKMPHQYIDHSTFPHFWNGGWLPEAVAFLVE